MEKNLGSSWDSNHLNTSHTYSEYLGFESQLDPIIHECLLLSPAAYDQPCIEPVIPLCLTLSTLSLLSVTSRTVTKYSLLSLPELAHFHC